MIIPQLAKCIVSGKSGCYASEDEARKALKEIKKHRTPHRKERAYYDCPHCDFWHLTEKSRQW